MIELHDNISQLQTAHPEALYIVAGDFNKACLKSVLPKLYQHVDCATRGDSTLDLVYTNIKTAYRATPLPHIGSSDHHSAACIQTQSAMRASREEKHQSVATECSTSTTRLLRVHTVEHLQGGCYI